MNGPWNGIRNAFVWNYKKISNKNNYLLRFLKWNSLANFIVTPKVCKALYLQVAIHGISILNFISLILKRCCYAKHVLCVKRVKFWRLRKKSRKISLILSFSVVLCSAKNLMNLSSRWKNYECRGVVWVSPLFVVTPCILGAALGWSYDQRMAERVSVVKKSRLFFFGFTVA